MPSTLNGIYNAQRALAINQAAIDIINNNVANINTPGYSKQRVDVSQAVNLSPSDNPLDASQSGLGAYLDGISRNRDVFIDNSYRKVTTDLNYYKEYTDNAVQLENMVNELGDTGLSKSLSDFYNGLSQLASNPDDYVTRNSLVQSAVTLATKFNDTYSELQNARTDLVGDVNNPDTINQSKLSISINDLNNKLSAIANLNEKINLSSAQGITPNSLLDQRDQLLDQISEYIPASIKYEKNDTVTIYLGSVQLVSGKEQTGIFSIKAGNVNNPSVVQIKNAGGSTFSSDAYSILGSGKIGAMLQMGGSDASKLTIKGMLDSLNTLANQFASAINTVQTGGRYIDNSVSPHELSNNTSNPIDGSQALDPDPENFFIDSDSTGTITAGNIKVNDTIVNNPYQIAAAGLSANFDETGDGTNVLSMAQVRNQNIAALGGTSTQGFITNLIGKMGTQSKDIQDNYDIKNSIQQQISQKRQSLTGVNLDEELTDLVRYQKSYEASAKVMTVLSQTLTTIMNMVG